MLKIQKRASLPKRKEIMIQTLAVLLSLVFAGLVILAMGYNPFEVYVRIVEGSLGTIMRIQQTVTKAIPLIIVSMGILVAFKMKFWNIGGEGQIMMGAFGATLVALNLPETLPLPLMLLSMAVVNLPLSKLNRPDSSTVTPMRLMELTSLATPFTDEKIMRRRPDLRRFAVLSPRRLPVFPDSLS